MAETARESIVSFRRPPVVEVVAGVTFDGLGEDAGPLLGAFWKECLRQQFPSLQQQPPYFPSDEQFPPEVGGLVPTLRWSSGLPPVRLWAQSTDGKELLQLQPGWFACNWRKVQPDCEYDRWWNRREAFRQHFNSLSDYMAVEGAGQPKVRQCEVTYINHIPTSASWSDLSEFSKVFRVASPPDVPFPSEQLACQIQFVLSNLDGQPYGRLYAKIFPALGPDGKTLLYVFELTARGAPQGDGVDGALSFLDLGRAAIDKTFLAFTTREMHEEWELHT
jgi:uncharacterized protein (TIGR04255 family)